MENENHPATQLPTPQVDNLIYRVGNLYEVKDDRAKGLVMDLFQKLQAVTVCGDDERRELWLTPPRGSIDDFGDYENYLENEEVENHEEFEELWQSKYPEPVKWYKLITTIYKDIYSVFLADKLVLQINPMPQEQYPYDKSELAAWLLAAVDEALTLLKAGRYNENVSQNLSYRKRLGKISWKDYWRIFPEYKDAYLKDITQAEIVRFVDLVKAQPSDGSGTRLVEMSAGKFFDCCRLGYEANRYEGIGKLTSKELYRAHADGRDDGLLNLNETSAKAFKTWFNDKDRYRGGHPWEICRGGNSTHISLYVQHDKSGWWLQLAGSSVVRSVETVKFYLALLDHGLTVFLNDSMEIAKTLTGKDNIGIVPEDMLPVYCASLFPDEKMLEFMNLPWEETEQVVKAAIWYPIREVHLS